VALPLDPFPVPPRGVLRYDVGSGFWWEAPPFPAFSELPLVPPGRQPTRGYRTTVYLCTEGIPDEETAIAAWVGDLRPEATAAKIELVLTELSPPGAGHWTLKISAMLGSPNPRSQIQQGRRTATRLFRRRSRFNDPSVPKEGGVKVYHPRGIRNDSFDEMVAAELAQLLDGRELWRPWPETEWELHRRGISFMSRNDGSGEYFFVEVVR
jgi:hypothetical protein